MTEKTDLLGCVRLLAFAAQAFYDNDGVHIYIVLWKNYYYVLLKNCLIFQWLDMMFHFLDVLLEEV